MAVLKLIQKKRKAGCPACFQERVGRYRTCSGQPQMKSQNSISIFDEAQEY